MGALPSFWDSTLDLLVISDLSGRLLRVSRAWETLLGYTESELVGRSYLELMHPDDGAAMASSATALIADSGVIKDVVARYRAKDGTYRSFLWRTRAVIEEGVAYGVGREIEADERARPNAPPVAREPLTPRESEVLELTAAGYTRAEIARRLVVSVRTVESHRKAVYRKLGISSQAELVSYALATGVLQPRP